VNSNEQASRIEDLINKHHPLTKTIFIFFLSIPPAISALLFTWAGDFVPVQNNVIALKVITLLYSILYLIIFFRKKIPSKWILNIFFINDKGKGIKAEKIAFNFEFVIKDGTKEIQLSPIDRERLFVFAKNVVKMKFVNRIAPLLTILTFLIIGLFGIGLN